MIARTRSSVLVALVALGALGATPAAAAPEGGGAPAKSGPAPGKQAPSKPAPVPTKPASPQDATRAKASEHAKQGQAYFARGDFDHAITEYQAAFDLTSEPLLVFNIALCHDRANRPEQALATFKRYLELAPTGDVAGEVRDDIARLTPIVEKLVAARAAEEARKREEAAKAPPPPPPPVKYGPRPARSPVPLIVVIGGAAIAATGGIFHAMSSGTRGDLETAPDVDTYYDARDKFRTQRAVAITGYSVGGAAMLTGLILGVTVFRRPEAPRISAAPTAGGAMVTLGWSR